MLEGRSVTKATVEASEQHGGVLETLLGARAWNHPWVRRLRELPDSWRVAGGAALIAALVFVPYVGAVGLWDPWETHYGEVGREMIARADYVYPYWESGWFFSKPPLTMWIDVLGMLLVGIEHGDGKLPLYTEWAMRLPFALMSAAALGVLAWALSRTVNRRVGLTAAFALATMPLYFLISRQAVTDTPFIAALIASMGCAILGLFDTGTTHRAGWWYAFYVLLGPFHPVQGASRSRASRGHPRPLRRFLRLPLDVGELRGARPVALPQIRRGGGWALAGAEAKGLRRRLPEVRNRCPSFLRKCGGCTSSPACSFSWRWPGPGT